MPNVRSHLVLWVETVCVADAIDTRTKTQQDVQGQTNKCVPQTSIIKKN